MREATILGLTTSLREQVGIEIMIFQFGWTVTQFVNMYLD